MNGKVQFLISFLFLDVLFIHVQCAVYDGVPVGSCTCERRCVYLCMYVCNTEW